MESRCWKRQRRRLSRVKTWTRTGWSLPGFGGPTQYCVFCFHVFLFFFKPSAAALSWWNRDSTGLRLLGQGRQGHWLTRASDTFTLSETERRTITHPSTPTRTYVDICSSGGMVQACWDQLILRPLNFRGDSKWYTSKRLRQNKTPNNNNNNNNSVLLSIDG